MSKALNTADTAQEHPLQAIVLCDAWGDEQNWGPIVAQFGSNDEDSDEEEHEEEERRKPVGEKRPWCLVPLLESPLLAWTLECLAAEGVQQAFLFAKDGVEEIREYLKTSPFSHPHSPLTLTLRPFQGQTPGDVLREVDGLQLLAPTDFLVVQAGYLGNVALEELVKDFSARRVRDKDLVLGCGVAKRSGPTTKTAIHVLSGPDDRLVHYEESPLFPRLRTATLPRETLEGSKTVKLRRDLEAFGVVVCSPEVPPLFTENFDYQFFYPDFVNGILTSDLLGKTICCCVVGDEKSTFGGDRWAGVVGDLRSYDFVAKALLKRNAYPLAPDENLPEGKERYEQRRGRVYIGKDVNLARTSSISTTSLVGSSSTLGSSTSINSSIISSSTNIGSESIIQNSYIFPGAQIGEGCKVVDSIVAEGCVVGEGSILEGVLLGRGVLTGKKARLSGVSVSTVGEGTKSGLGEGAQGFVSELEDNSRRADDDDSDEEEDVRNAQWSRLGTQLSQLSLSSGSTVSSLSRSSSTASLSTLASTTDLPTIQGLASLNLDSTNASPNPAGGAVGSSANFLSECQASLERSFAEGHTVDNAAIELKTLRMASNVPLGDVRDVVVPFLLERAWAGKEGGVPGIVKRWGGLIEAVTGESEESMQGALLSAQKFAVDHSEKLTATEKETTIFFQRTLKAFYEEDVISENAVFAWFKSPASRATGGELGRKLWNAAKPFIEALAEDDDDEDEDESDEQSD
ncbi:hypothetical protein T439DRAFT_309262 [Meredithblackwellia eburnea MCA 4105]